MKSIGKKGSHIEVILSFVIFVTFLVFMYTIVKPVIQKPIDREYLVNYVKENIKNEIMADLTYKSIEITNLQGRSCFEIQGNFGGDGISLAKVVVKDETNTKITQVWIDEGLWIDSNKERIYKFYFFEYFTKAQLNPVKECGDPLEEDKNYEVIEQKTNQYVSLTKLRDLQTKYSTPEGYVKLKDELKIPDGRNFGFSFKKSKGDTNPINAVKETAKGINVYAEEIPILYVDNDYQSATYGDIRTGFLTVKIW